MSGPDIEFEQLEAALRADSPEASAAFAAELDRRVAEGFPKPRRRLSVPSLWPALAAATVLVVVAVTAISVLGGRADRRVTATVHGNLEPRDLSSRAAPTANSLQQATSSGRRVERDVQLTIAAAHDKLQQAA